jgi:type II secretory pathway pseudopilin PulG
VSLELTGIVLAIVAIVALLYGGSQLAAMREGNQKQTESALNQELQTRATVLLSLDQRWENEPMLAYRADLEALIVNVKTEAAKLWLGQPESEIRKRSADLYAARLALMADENRQQYIKLLRICGFFETVGCVVHAGYVPAKDVLDLLRISILTAGMVFRPHIKKLVEEGAPDDFYENFLWIVEIAEQK